MNPTTCMHITHLQNIVGRDFFVGDIHGNYDQLLSKLEEVNFDRKVDRLFSTGDLIDRGPKSLACLRLTEEPWFFAVLGNHEDMFYDVLISDDKARTFTRPLHCGNGGDWAKEITKSEEAECREIIELLPLAQSILFEHYRIGLIHAGWGWPWEELSTEKKITAKKREHALWDRLDNSNLQEAVAGIDMVVSGHQNTDHPVVKGNQVWIDTLGPTGDLTLLEAPSLLKLVAD